MHFNPEKKEKGRRHAGRGGFGGRGRGGFGGRGRGGFSGRGRGGYGLVRFGRRGRGGATGTLVLEQLGEVQDMMVEEDMLVDNMKGTAGEAKTVHLTHVRL